MNYKNRLLEFSLTSALGRGKSVLLLGPRQTGKTTLISRLGADLTISFVRPDIRQRYEKRPDLLAGEVEALARSHRGEHAMPPLVILDEVQKLPASLDVVQDLIDRQVARFVLCGSSARKLRRDSAVNLLPGRVVMLRLDPFMLAEDPAADLDDHLLYGALPGIRLTEAAPDREADLRSYVVTYLEEEVRAEALVRDVGLFARFLDLAGSEAGRVVNCSRLSQEIGVAHTTVASYFEILEDCLIAERITPLTHSRGRRKLTKSHKYLLFDLGVRRLCAGEGTALSQETMGHLFEQFVGLELIRAARLCAAARVLFWRDPDGPEVDWVIEQSNRYTPIEVKWTTTPRATDAKHLAVFLREYENAEEGFVVCRTPRRVQLADNITALPWQELPTLLALPASRAASRA